MQSMRDTGPLDYFWDIHEEREPFVLCVLHSYHQHLREEKIQEGICLGKTQLSCLERIHPGFIAAVSVNQNNLAAINTQQ